MRYWVVCLAFCICSCTCNNNSEEETTEVPADSIPSTGNASLVNEYSNFLKNLDTAHLDYSAIAAEKFEKQFANANPATADSAYVLFSAFYDEMLNKLVDAHYKEGSNSSAFSFSKDSIVPTTPKAKRYLTHLQSNGFTLATSEGSTYVKQDFGFVMKHFAPHISATMRSYLEQLLKESEEGFLNDAALVISPKQLADRILFWEAFLKQHPGFVYKEKIEHRQREFTTFFLEGVDNTPLYSLNSNQLSAPYAAAFDYVLKSHPNSTLARHLKPYYEALKSNSKKEQQLLLNQYRKQRIILDFSE